MKIGICGPISEVNFGDYGMLINNVYDLGVNNEYVLYFYERHNVTAFDQIVREYFFKYKITKYKLNFKSVSTKDYTIKSSLKRVKDKILRKLNLSKPQNANYLTPIEIINKSIHYDRLKESIEKLDVLVVNGGGYFNHLWATWYRKEDLYKIMLPIIIANILKKKIFFTGNSYGPFDNTAEFYSVFFNSLDMVKFGSRDMLLSPSYLRSLGVLDKDIVLLPDDLLFLNSKIVSSNKNNNKKIINNKYIVIETYISTQDMSVYKDCIIRLLDSLKNKYQHSVVFIPFQKDHGGELQGEYLRNISNGDDFYLYDIRSKGFPEIVDVYNLIKHASLVIGTRYHTLVMALGARTPVVNTVKVVGGDFRYYYNKNLGVLNTVFQNQDFEPKDFLFYDQKEAFTYVCNEFRTIVKRQNSLFNDKYKKQLSLLSLERKKYFNEILSQ